MILGVDIGNKFITTSTIQNNNMDVITNSQGKRKSHNIVHINMSDGYRTIGDLAYFKPDTQNTLSNINYDILMNKEYMLYHPYFCAR